MAVWCGPPAVSQLSAAVARSGFGRHTARATGRRGSGASGATTSTSLAISRNRSPRSARPRMTRRAGRGVEHEPDGVRAAADRQRMDLAGRAARGDRRADLEHVRPEHLRDRIAEVVRVVLHERRPAGQALGHDLEDAHEGRGLPVALGAEAVALGHQALDADPGQLPELAEVLERVGEGAEAAVLEERPQPGLDPRGDPELGPPVAGRPQARGHVVRRVVGLDERVDVAPRRPRRPEPPGR